MHSDEQGAAHRLRRVRTRGAIGFEEPPPVGGTIRVDPIPQPVDDYVMVVPTDGCLVLGMVAPALPAGDDVVGLQPIAALTTVDHTTPVSGQDGATEPGGEVGEGVSHRKEPALTRD